jgi:uncharacterized membrane protein
VLIYGAYAALILVYARSKGLFTPHASPPDPQMMVIFVVSSVVFIFLLIGALVYGIIMSLRYSLAISACTVEDLTARAAIRRSIQLSKGSRGRIFMLALLAVIIQLGLTGITQAFFIVVGLKNHGVLPVWMSVMQQFLAFLTNTFVGPIFATGFTLFYYDQRVRKEGYDIERMMHHAGMSPTLPAVESNSALEVATPVDQGTGHE